jgi:hypothetical protein
VPVWLAILSAFVGGAGLVYFFTSGDRSSRGVLREATTEVAGSSTPSPAAATDGLGSAVAGASQQGGSPEPARVAPTKGRINLLSSANGGHLMAAPNDSWRFVIDDDTTRWLYLPAGNGDGVYAFKNEQAATFDTFLMLLEDTAPINIKEFELLAGNEAPLGSFESIGRFQTQNIRLYPSPWQEFKFPPVRARFFKLHVISTWDPTWNGMPKVIEWQLLGSF